ncbi:septal ring lytic transglycosylase RlpA family lipoprotein [Candidatus Fermentibacteria bacterium]|nr:MAG: septal ring lytic transglycosylase RlpA family lipoprotein [Candidatus Fermentibacteria bacterium]
MRKAAASAVLLVLFSGCSLVSSPAYVYRSVPASAAIVSGFIQRGAASWYGRQFHGRPTASGETYDMNDMTCAHRTLPFGTVLLVTNLDNGLSATVRVNDRGPYISGRIIDLSRGAASVLGIISTGTAQVELKAVGNE